MEPLTTKTKAEEYPTTGAFSETTHAHICPALHADYTILQALYMRDNQTPACAQAIAYPPLAACATRDHDDQECCDPNSKASSTLICSALLMRMMAELGQNNF